MKHQRAINPQSPTLLRSTVRPPHHRTGQRVTRRPTLQSTTPPPLLPGTNPSGITSRGRTSRQSQTPCLTVSSPTTRRFTINTTPPQPPFLLSPTSRQNLKTFLTQKSFQNIIRNTKRHTTIQLFLTENPTHQKSQMFLTTTSFPNTQQQPRLQRPQPTLLLQLQQRLPPRQLQQPLPQRHIQLQQPQLQQHIQQLLTRLQQPRQPQQLGTNQ